MTTSEILETLEDHFPEALLAGGFNDAILGVAEGWFDHSRETVVCYDFRKCVQILTAQGMDEEGAEEYLDFNTLGAYLGEGTPVFLHRWRSEKKSPANGDQSAHGRIT